jgi:hypothetical protein
MCTKLSKPVLPTHDNSRDRNRLPLCVEEDGRGRPRLLIKGFVAVAGGRIGQRGVFRIARGAERG